MNGAGRGSPARLAAVVALLAALSGCSVGLGPRPFPDPLPDPLPEPVPQPTPQPPPRPSVAEVEPAPGERVLPPVQVEQLGRGDVPLGVPIPEEPLEPQPRGERVTLTAVDTEVRPLLAALAEAAGVNLVVAPPVRGRITVHFEDVPAVEALEQVVRESGYMIAQPLVAPFPPTVYYVVPVNVNEADAATIQARFGVSPELARFLVRARIPPS